MYQCPILKVYSGAWYFVCWIPLNIYITCILQFLDTEIPQVVEILPRGRQDQIITHSQYHGYWYRGGDGRSQVPVALFLPSIPVSSRQSSMLIIQSSRSPNRSCIAFCDCVECEHFTCTVLSVYWNNKTLDKHLATLPTFPGLQSH